MTMPRLRLGTTDQGATSQRLEVVGQPRRRILILAGALAIVALAAMQPSLNQMRDRGHDIVALELAFTEERSDEVLADWGEPGKDAARRQLWIDFAFIVAWGAFLALAAAATRDLAQD